MLNLLQHFHGEEPAHVVHFELFQDKLHSMLTADLTDQVDSIPVVSTAPTQAYHTGQEGCGSTLTIILSLCFDKNKNYILLNCTHSKTHTNHKLCSMCVTNTICHLNYAPGFLSFSIMRVAAISRSIRTLAICCRYSTVAFSADWSCDCR